MAYASPPKAPAEQQAPIAQLRASSPEAVFSDNRESTVGAMQLKGLMDASPIHQQAHALTQLMANSHTGNVFRPVQRVEEELLQGKFSDATTQRVSEAPGVNNTGLPDQLKSGIENLSGMSMDHVKVHYNSAEPAQLNAHAYAQGSDIHVAPGQEKHLPHEAWHVVQQAQGRVKPTVQMKNDVPVNDDVSLESEADIMGEKAMSASGTDAIAVSSAVLPAATAQLKSVIQLHKGENNYDEELDDIIIYIVVTKIDDNVVYVGQTEDSVGIDKRFEQHQRVHDWPSRTHKIVRKEAGTWTRLEASCAEQYWIDHYGFDNLENDRNQITKAHFNELMEWADENDATIFRGEEIGFPKGWKPKN